VGEASGDGRAATAQSFSGSAVRAREVAGDTQARRCWLRAAHAAHVVPRMRGKKTDMHNLA